MKKKKKRELPKLKCPLYTFMKLPVLFQAGRNIESTRYPNKEMQLNSIIVTLCFATTREPSPSHQCFTIFIPADGKIKVFGKVQRVFQFLFRASTIKYLFF